MLLVDFEKAVAATPNLELKRVEGGYGIAHTLVAPTSPEDEPETVMYTALDAAILTHEWATLEKILLGKREPIILQRVTRVCGYFASTANFNASKRGELRARRAGNYSFPGYQDVHAPAPKKKEEAKSPTAPTPPLTRVEEQVAAN